MRHVQIALFLATEALVFAPEHGCSHCQRSHVSTPFPCPLDLREDVGGYVVRDANGQALAYLYPG